MRPAVLLLAALSLVSLSGTRFAHAQCYSFSSGSDASLAINIPKLPAPSVTREQDRITYNYPVTSAITSLTIEGTTVTGVSSYLSISIVSGASDTILTMQVSGSFPANPNPPGGSLSVGLYLEAGPNPAFPLGLLPNGLPITLPGISNWTVTQNNNITGAILFPATVIRIPGVYGSPITSIGSACSPLTPSPPTLVDPVSSLLIGSGITTSAAALSDPSKGTVVQGVASDGVAQLVIRIPARAVGEQFDVAVKANQCSGTNLSTSDCIDEYGLLFDPTSPPSNGAALFANTLPQNITGVTSIDTPNGPMALVAYRAPVDFARPDLSGTQSSDNGSASRTVTLTITSHQNGAQSNLGVAIVRPPVFLVHGFNTDSSAWDNFAPLTNDTRLFKLYKPDYGKNLFTPIYGMAPPGNSSRGGIPTTYVPTTPYNVTSTSPPIPVSSIHQGARLSHLGFTVTEPIVTNFILTQINSFRTGDNPLSIPVAAVAADVVAHSMGGLVIRQWTTRTADYLSMNSYGRGSVHKLITIATPHLGTPQAVLSTLPASSCARNLAAQYPASSLAFESATISNSAVVMPGAAGQLEGDGIGKTMSQALTTIASSATTIPIATIAGEVSDLIPDVGGVSALAHFLCPNDPLGSRYTPSGFQTIFDPLLATGPLTPVSQTTNVLSDGSVPLTSALMIPDMTTASACLTNNILAGQCFPRYTHSSGIAQFFSGSVNYLLDGSRGVAEEVEVLLNTSVRSKVFTRGN